MYNRAVMTCESEGLAHHTIGSSSQKMRCIPVHDDVPTIEPSNSHP